MSCPTLCMPACLGTFWYAKLLLQAASLWELLMYDISRKNYNKWDSAVMTTITYWEISASFEFINRVSMMAPPLDLVGMD